MAKKPDSSENRSLGYFAFENGEVVNRESQFAREAPGFRDVDHARRVPAVFLKRRHGTDLSRCKGQEIDGVLQTAEMQTPPRAEAGLTRPDRTVCTSILFVRSDDRSAIEGFNERLRDTRLLHGLSGEITASGGFDRNASTEHALNITANSATKLGG